LRLTEEYDGHRKRCEKKSHPFNPRRSRHEAEKRGANDP